MRVNEWIYHFAQRHAARCRKPGWPPIDPEMPTQECIDHFTPWVERFVRSGVIEPVAEHASIEMAKHDYPFPGGAHLDAFMKYIPGAVVAIESHRRGHLADSREDADARSHDCPECGGGGLTNRWMDRGGRKYSFAMYCLCPIGEWIAFNHYNHSKDVFRRMRRLAQYPELWNPDLRHRAWPVEPAGRAWPAESWLMPIRSAQDFAEPGGLSVYDPAETEGPAF